MDKGNKNDQEKEFEESEEHDIEELINEDENQEQKVEKKDGVLEKLEECETKYKRALADYQNLEKRVREERIDWIKQANRDMILRILPVLDTLMLALAHGDDQTIKVTIDQFLGVLRDEGVLRIETVGKKFDPFLMEGIEKLNDGDDVVEEVRAGYLMHDKLLRPAQVKVGKKK